MIICPKCLSMFICNLPLIPDLTQLPRSLSKWNIKRVLDFLAKINIYMLLTLDPTLLRHNIVLWDVRYVLSTQVYLMSTTNSWPQTVSTQHSHMGWYAWITCPSLFAALNLSIIISYGVFSFVWLSLNNLLLVMNTFTPGASGGWVPSPWINRRMFF